MQKKKGTLECREVRRKREKGVEEKGREEQRETNELDYEVQKIQKVDKKDEDRFQANLVSVFLG